MRQNYQNVRLPRSLYPLVYVVPAALECCAKKQEHNDGAIRIKHIVIGLHRGYNQRPRPGLPIEQVLVATNLRQALS